MTTRAFSDHFNEDEIEAEHQRALALIREDVDRQRRLGLSFAPRPIHCRCSRTWAHCNVSEKSPRAQIAELP